MKKNYLLLILLLPMLSSIITVGCKTKDEIRENQLSELTEHLRKDPDYMALLAAADEIGKKQLNGEINTRNIDRRILDSNPVKPTTLEEQIKLYEKAGVIGAKEYLTLLHDMQVKMNAVCKKYPMYKTISSEESSKIRRELFHSNIDVDPYLLRKNGFGKQIGTNQ